MTNKLWRTYCQKTEHLLRRYSCSEGEQRRMCEIIEKLPKKAVVLELGTSYGLTAGFFLLAGQKNEIEYHGVDNFSLESKYNDVKESLDKLGLPYDLHAVRTQDFAWDRPIDFLFVDAGHDEANARPDIERYVPLVKSGGYVAFHDYDGCKDPSITPHWAVTYYGDIATQGWKEIDYLENQLMIRQRP